jgi:flagellin-like hook-associated protein FlgL
VLTNGGYASWTTVLAGGLEIVTSGATTSNAKIADFITRLIALRDGLNNTAGAADGGTAAISAARANLLTSDNDIIGILADNAAMQTRIEAVKTQASSRFDNLGSLISKDADVDIAQTTVNLTRARTAYQAAMQAGAQMLKLSLLDYIP